MLKAPSAIKGAFSRKVVGSFLLVAGLFFTMAFLTGQGAFLGKAGLAAATGVAGVVGFALPPLAVLVGFLMLLGRLPRERTLGATLLLLASATILAAYSDRGGLLGSGLYAAIHWVGGSVGAALVLGFLYAVGLSLSTGVTLRAAVLKMGDGARSLYLKLRTLREEHRAKAPPREEVESPTAPVAMTTSDDATRRRRSG